MNYVFLVGSVDQNPEIILHNNNRKSKLIKFRMKVEKPYKAKNGEILEDFVTVKIWNNKVDDIDTILEVENIIGVKGHISSYKAKDLENTDTFYNEILADKIFYIS